MVTLSDTLTFLRKDVAVTVTMIDDRDLETRTGSLCSGREELLHMTVATIQFFVSDPAFQDIPLSLTELLAILRQLPSGFTEDDHLHLIYRYLNMRQQEVRKVSVFEPAPQPVVSNAAALVLSNSYQVVVEDLVNLYRSFDLDQQELATAIFRELFEGGRVDELVVRNVNNLPECLAVYPWVARLRQSTPQVVQDVVTKILELQRQDDDHWAAA
jgi:hypothetical protein